MNIRKKLIKLGALAATTGLAFTSANAIDYNATAIATVVDPLTINEDAIMNFGTISGGANIGTVVLAPNGSRTVTGDAQILAAGAGAAGVFTVTGQSGLPYTLSFTAGSLDDGVGGGAPMAVDTFTTTNFTGTLAGGSETFQVGATLRVGANQANGNYSTATNGTPYTVTFNYQ